MEYSWRYRNSLNGVFAIRRPYQLNTVLNSNITFDKSNIFNRMLVTDISSDEIEIPIVARETIENVIFDNIIKKSDIKKVVIPLYVNSDTLLKRSADTIVQYFFSNTPFYCKLQKIITGKGEIYYGNKGLIFDQNFNPLILCGIKCRKIMNNSRIHIEYYKPVIYISPEVFINNDRMLNKSIVKKIIPFYLTNKITNIYTSNTIILNSIPINTKPDILIQDINKFIEYPVVPKLSNLSEDSFNDFLIEHIDEILENI